MEQFDLVTPDEGAADANNPYGTYLDEGGGDPGTPILAGWKNTIKAFFERLITETNKTFSGNPDSAVVSQGFDMFMQLVSGLDPALAEWAAGTFNQNGVTRYRGLQWFVGVASTINTPSQNSEWAASPTMREVMKWASSDGPLKGGFLPLNNIRDLTNYATYYKIGKYDWYDAKLEAWWLNIDGSAHTSATSDVAKLLALSKFAAEVILSDTAGTLTLKDYTGKLSRAVDAVAGFTQDIGDEQEDQFQGFWLAPTDEASKHLGGQTPDQGTAGAAGNTDLTIPGFQNTASGLDASVAIPVTDTVNGPPRIGEKTRDRTYAEGVTGLVIVVPEGTI